MGGASGDPDAMAVVGAVIAVELDPLAFVPGLLDKARRAGERHNCVEIGVGAEDGRSVFAGIGDR